MSRGGWKGTGTNPSAARNSRVATRVRETSGVSIMGVAARTPRGSGANVGVCARRLHCTEPSHFDADSGAVCAPWQCISSLAAARFACCACIGHMPDLQQSASPQQFPAGHAAAGPASRLTSARMAIVRRMAHEFITSAPRGKGAQLRLARLPATLSRRVVRLHRLAVRRGPCCLSSSSIIPATT